MKVLVFDTETTGLPQSRIISPDDLGKWPYIVQFSFVGYDTSTNIITERYNKIIKLPPSISIPEEATHIHKITNEMSMDSDTSLEEVLDEFFYTLKTADLLVGHNIEFDINMIRVELLRRIFDINHSFQGLEPIAVASLVKKYKKYLYTITTFKNIFCTLKETIHICNIQAVNKAGNSYTKYPKLVELHQTLFQTTPNELHNSLVDILVTLRCFVKLKYDTDILTNCRIFKRYVQTLNIYD